MRTLLIDIGNSRIKWAVLASNGRLGRQRACAHDGRPPRGWERMLFEGAGAIERVVAVSVAPDSFERAIVRAATRRKIGRPHFVHAARSIGGVTTCYTEPWRLGADRLVAAIGAHALARSRTCCIVDVGTAMTLDILDARGRHLGGAIVPGPRLMAEALLQDTHGIKARAAGARVGARNFFARNARAAVQAGADYAVAATIDRAVLEAGKRLGPRPLVLLTGGAAAAVAPLLRTRSIRKVPDLVLRGLAELSSRHLR